MSYDAPKLLIDFGTWAKMNWPLASAIAYALGYVVWKASETTLELWKLRHEERELVVKEKELELKTREVAQKELEFKTAQEPKPVPLVTPTSAQVSRFAGSGSYTRADRAIRHRASDGAPMLKSDKSRTEFLYLFKRSRRPGLQIPSNTYPAPRSKPFLDNPFNALFAISLVVVTGYLFLGLWGWIAVHFGLGN